jgi:hypothetical protein
MISRSIAESNINELRNSMLNIVLFGKNCLNAVVTVQKAYRRFKLRQKIARLQKVYQVTIQNNARVRAKRFIRRALKVVIAKQARSDAKDLMIRNLKLFEIRINLAKISIKKYLERNNISVKDITQHYKSAKWAKIGVSLLEPKPATASTNLKPVSRKQRTRMYFNSYRPVLAQRNSRLLQPTQSSNSKSRIRICPSLHQRNKSEFSLYSRPTRPSTPYRF